MLPPLLIAPTRRATRPASRSRRPAALASRRAGRRPTDERPMRMLEILLASGVLAGSTLIAFIQPVDGNTVRVAATLAGALVLLVAALVALLR